MKTILLVLILITLASCLSLDSNCSESQDNSIPISIEKELILAKNQLVERFDSIQAWNLIDQKLAGQKAGILANISMGLWNLIDGAYLESITVKNEHLIFFEFYTNACKWKKEYVVYNNQGTALPSYFKDQEIKIDTIQLKWQFIRVRKN